MDGTLKKKTLAIAWLSFFSFCTGKKKIVIITEFMFSQ